MSSRAWLSVVVSGLAVGLVLCGCSPTSGKSWGAGGGSITLTENGSRIAYALERLTRDDEVYLVIAANGQEKQEKVSGTISEMTDDGKVPDTFLTPFLLQCPAPAEIQPPSPPPDPVFKAPKRRPSFLTIRDGGFLEGKSYVTVTRATPAMSSG
jgi:hypothetical protein